MLESCWNEQDMIGVALCTIGRHDQTVGEVEELSVRRGQRLGIGRVLLLDGLRSLREHGATTARLFTGTTNPYRSYDLYESVGFRRQNEYVRYRKCLPLALQPLAEVRSAPETPKCRGRPYA